MAIGKKTGGRKKGTPNKISGAIRQDVLAAFARVGGAKYLEKVARKQPAVFCNLLAKLLPTELANAGDTPLLINMIKRVIVDPVANGTAD
jgi:hypothetical protein